MKLLFIILLFLVAYSNAITKAQLSPDVSMKKKNNTLSIKIKRPSYIKRLLRDTSITNTLLNNLEKDTNNENLQALFQSMEEKHLKKIKNLIEDLDKTDTPLIQNEYTLTINSNELQKMLSKTIRSQVPDEGKDIEDAIPSIKDEIPNLGFKLAFNDVNCCNPRKTTIIIHNLGSGTINNSHNQHESDDNTTPAPTFESLPRPPSAMRQTSGNTEPIE